MDAMSEVDSNFNDEQEVQSNNLDLNEIDTQVLKQLYEKDRDDITTKKNNDQWLLHSSQMELEKNVMLQEEQNDIIIQLQTRAEELLQRAENESQMRVKIAKDIDKVKRNMIILKTYFEGHKKTMERCVEMKNRLEKTFQKSAENLDNHQKENYASIKSHMIKNSKLAKSLKQEHLKYISLEKKSLAIQEEKNNEISILKDSKLKLKSIIQELENKNSSVLKDMNDLVEQKDELLNELTKSKENYEKCMQDIEEYKNVIEQLKKQISFLEQSQIMSKQSIENLKKEKEDFEKSLNDQNEFMSEIQAKNDLLDALVSKLEQENAALKISKSELETEVQVKCDNLQFELTAAQNNCVHLEDSISVLKDDHNTLKQEYETSKDIIMTLTNKIEEKQDKIVAFEEIIMKLKQDFHEELEMKKEKQDCIEKLQQDIKNKDQALENLNEKYYQLEQEESSSKASMQDRLDNIFIEKENLKTEIETLLQKLEDITQRNEEKIKEVNEEADKKIKDIVDHNEIYKCELEKIRQNEEVKHTQEITKLTNVIKKMELQMNEIKASKQSLEKELNQKIRETEQLAQEKETMARIESKPSSQVLNDATKVKEDMNSSQINLEKRSFMTKLREPLQWDDSWSDSSMENEYIGKSWQTKTSGKSGMRVIPQKRKLQTQVDDIKQSQTNTEDLFDSLRESSTMFKQPLEKKPSKVRRHSRKTVY